MAVDLIELGRLADVNLAESWAVLGHVGGGAVGGSDECRFAATGIPAAFFNGAYATRPVGDPDRVVDDAVAFMGEREAPWLLWVREGIDDALLDAGRRAGLSDAGGPPCMVLPSIPSLPAQPDGLSIEVVADDEGVEAFRDVTTRGFGMPSEFVARLIPHALVVHPTVSLVVGRVDGEPVSCALVSVTGRTAGVYNVGTPEEFRRRGYGAALTWAAIEQGRRQGCDHAILQASELGAPVYRSMGFVDVGTYLQLEGPPPA